MPPSEEILFDPEEAKARGFDARGVALARYSQEAHAAAVGLLGEVEAAFAGVPRPRITLSVARAYDEEWNLSPEREAQLRACDPEQDWREADVSQTSASWYFNFSDAEGCRFYLPAFLKRELECFPFSGRDGILWLFENPSRTALLSAAQMACLERFATLCERYPEHPSNDEF